MTEAERLARETLMNAQREQMTHSAQAEPRSETQRFRTALQGLTFGGADEAEAYLVSTLTGKDYDTVLDSVRGKLEKYKGERPWEALGYEVGGAALPAIAASIFTGGGVGAATASRLFPTLARLWKAAPPVVRATSAASVGGGLYAYGTGEGSAADRARRVPAGMTAGALGGAGGYAVGKGASKVAGEFLDYVARKVDDRVSRRVEQELAKIVADSGMTPDEVLARVSAGELMPEMSKMLRDTLRGFYSKSRGAATMIEDVYNTRPEVLRRETMDYLQGTMTDGIDGNVLRTVRQGEEAMTRAAGQEYDDVFRAAPALADDVTGQLKAALARVPEAGDDVKRIYTARTGKKPFFEISKDGQVTFNRAPTLEDAEIIRRGLNDATSRQFRTGAGSVGAAYRDVEGGLRQAIDDASLPLKEVRAKWAGIEKASKAFESGRKALGRSPDEVAVEFDAISRQGEEAVAAYRAGLVDAFRKQSSTGSGKSLPANIANPERKEGLILRTVFPEDNLDELLGKADLASRALGVANNVMSQSPTQITRDRNAQLGGSILEGALDVGANGTYGLIRLASQAIKALQPELSDREVQRLAGLMLESNPEVLRKAMTDTTAVAQVNTLAQQFLQRLPEATGRAMGRAAIPAGEFALR